jgi:hypothetical protein
MRGTRLDAAAVDVIRVEKMARASEGRHTVSKSGPNTAKDGDFRRHMSGFGAASVAAAVRRRW